MTDVNPQNPIYVLVLNTRTQEGHVQMFRWSVVYVYADRADDQIACHPTDDVWCVAL